MNRVLIGIVMLLCCPGVGFAAGKAQDVKKGNAFYEEGKYLQALEKYTEALKKDPNSDIINFNAGTALYKQGDYTAAAEHLQKTLLGEDETLKQKSYYNLGNTFYQSGIAQQDKNIGQAVQFLEKSLSSYERALALDETDKDAKYNYDYAKKELERLKEKQQRQRQKQKQSGQGQQQESQPQSGQQDPQQQNQQQQEQPRQGPSEDNDNQKQQPQAGQEGQQGEEQQQQEQRFGQQQESSSSGSPKQSETGEQKALGQDSQTKAGDMSEEEARMLLKDYQQNDEPQGFFMLRPPSKNSSETIQDW